MRRQDTTGKARGGWRPRAGVVRQCKYIHDACTSASSAASEHDASTIVDVKLALARLSAPAPASANTSQPRMHALSSLLAASGPPASATPASSPSLAPLLPRNFQAPTSYLSAFFSRQQRHRARARADCIKTHTRTQRMRSVAVSACAGVNANGDAWVSGARQQPWKPELRLPPHASQ